VQDDQKVFGWHDTMYDQLIERAWRITDQQERMQLYRRAEQILVQAMPMLITTYWQVHVLLKPRLKNYRMARMKQQFWQEIVIEDK
jgi:ABC-type transport system substrate-binding protein